MKETRSGDTIIEEGDPSNLTLKGLLSPPSVFFCSIEPENSRDNQLLMSILRNLSREDPSIQVKEDEQNS